jgi:heat shock protein HslJ
MLLTIAALLQVPAAASTPEALEALNRASESACLRAAGLQDARISGPTRYSDALGIEARIVDGRAPEGETGRTTLLCVYHRGTGQAEVRAFDREAELAYSRQVRDVVWHAVDIAGQAPVGSDIVTLSLGSDGRVSGRSGCNLYSALYQLDGEALEVVWPMTGTRRNCVPAVMDQEVRFRQIVLRGRNVRLQDDGSLLLTDRDGASVRFVRAEGEMRP